MPDNIFNHFNNRKQGLYIRVRETNKSQLLLMKSSKDKTGLRVLTIEELKAFEGLGDLSDEHTKEMITILKDFSLMGSYSFAE